MSAKLKQLVADYGSVALFIYLTLFVAVLVGLYVGIRVGWAPRTLAGNAGAWAAAYVGTKLTQPFRIGATVLLTPTVGRLWRERRARA